ncbi:MAG: hypothetical protein RLZZ540_360 [Bacteroidota bacterium]|jgi:predicted dehydrogenase
MNVLIVGLGSIAKKHLVALQSLSFNKNIYALRSSINADEVDGVTNVFNLDDVTILFDFAIISNPTNLHCQYIEILSQKSIPLFIEKPAVHSLENVDEILQLVSQNNTVTYVACNLRFHPCITFLKNKFDSEDLRINELNVYCGSYLPDWRPGKDYRKIYSANIVMGGGVHLDLFHELDYTTWLFGFPNISNAFCRSVSSLAIDAFDYANYVLQYDSFTASLVLNYYRRKPKREIEIVLENEIWTVNLLENTIKKDNGELLFEALDFNIKDTYKDQMIYFIEGLKDNRQPMNSLEESIKVLKICLQNER